MADRHADLADFATREDMVAIVARLRRQIEGDAQARLPLGQVGAVELVAFRRCRVARIGAENPWGVGRVLKRLGHGRRANTGSC